MIFNFVGLVWKLRLSYTGLILLSIYNVPIIGGFLIGLHYMHVPRVDIDTTTFVLMTIPLMILFLLGLFNIRIVHLLENEKEHRDHEHMLR